jgi:hypothetical protein
MAEFKISVDLSGVTGTASDIVNQQVFPLLTQAVRAMANATAQNWQQAVYQAKLWSGEKDAYMSSIQMKMTGPFAALVWSDYKYAEEIETGRPPRDLKRMLDTSLKVRTSKKGKRYLIIPFRHNTPGNDALGQSMPPDVYELAKEMAPSSIVGQKQRLSGTGAFDIKSRQRLTVPQNVYSWGGRLDFMKVGNFEKAPNAKRIHQGMYRFDTTTPGGARSSVYLTFRTMVEGSPGWIIPAQPGLYLAKKTADDMQPIAEEAFGEAMKRTLG